MKSQSFLFPLPQFILIPSSLLKSVGSNRSNVFPFPRRLMNSFLYVYSSCFSIRFYYICVCVYYLTLQFFSLFIREIRTQQGTPSDLGGKCCMRVTNVESGLLGCVNLLKIVVHYFLPSFIALDELNPFLIFDEECLICSHTPDGRTCLNWRDCRQTSPRSL